MFCSSTKCTVCKHYMTQFTVHVKTMLYYYRVNPQCKTYYHLIPNNYLLRGSVGGTSGNYTCYCDHALLSATIPVGEVIHTRETQESLVRWLSLSVCVCVCVCVRVEHNSICPCFETIITCFETIIT